MPSNETASGRTWIFKFLTAVTRLQIESSEHLPLWQCHDFLTAASLHPAWPRNFSFKNFLPVCCQVVQWNIDLQLPHGYIESPVSFSPAMEICFFPHPLLRFLPGNWLSPVWNLWALSPSLHLRKEIGLLKTLIFIGCVYPAHCLQSEGGHGPLTLSLHVGSR